MTSSTIEHAMQALANADPDIARAYPLVGSPNPRQRGIPHGRSLPFG